MTLRMQKNLLSLVNIEGQYTILHMHAFYESLRYAFLMKFDQHVSDMTAVNVLKF